MHKAGLINGNSNDDNLGIPSQIKNFSKLSAALKLTQKTKLPNDEQILYPSPTKIKIIGINNANRNGQLHSDNKKSEDDMSISKYRITKSIGKVNSNLIMPSKLLDDKIIINSPETQNKRIHRSISSLSNISILSIKKRKSIHNDSDISLLNNAESLEDPSKKLLDSLGKQILKLKEISMFAAEDNKDDDEGLKAEPKELTNVENKNIKEKVSKKKRLQFSDIQSLLNDDLDSKQLLSQREHNKFHMPPINNNKKQMDTSLNQALSPLLYSNPYNNANMKSLIVIPQKDIIPNPIDKNSSFRTFNDIYNLYKNGATKDSTYVKTIQAFLELEKSKALAMENPEKRRYDSKEASIFIIQKELEFNRIQANSVDKILQSPDPLQINYNQVQDEIKKKVEKMPKIKSYPKRRLEDELPRPKYETPALPSLDLHSVFTFFWFDIEKGENIGGIRPEAREGGAICNMEKNIVLFGGASKSLMDDIWCYDIVTKNWTKQDTIGESPQGRHGHAAIAYRNQYLITYGGESGFNSQMRIRQCLRDVRSFNIRTKEWKLLSSSLEIEARRNHAIAIKGDFLYVYGGLDSNSRVLDDLWMFNLHHCIWKKVIPEVEDNQSSGLAYHTMAFVNNEKYSEQKVIHEGFYVFGGKDGENKIVNTLKIFDIAQKKWIYPATKGDPPYPRYKHSMSFYQTGLVLVVYGGKNDTLYETGKTALLSDMKILDLLTLTWHTAYCQGYIPDQPRHYHSSAINGSYLYIFGGMTETTYTTADIRIVEMNTLHSKQLVKEQLALKNDESQNIGNNDSKNNNILKKFSFDAEGISTFLPIPKKTIGSKIDLENGSNNTGGILTTKTNKKSNYNTKKSDQQNANEIESILNSVANDL